MHRDFPCAGAPLPAAGALFDFIFINLNHLFKSKGRHVIDLSFNDY